MPYRSTAQRAYMHAKLPDIAARWDAKYGGKVGAKKKMRHKKKHGGMKVDAREVERMHRKGMKDPAALRAYHRREEAEVAKMSKRHK